MITDEQLTKFCAAVDEMRLAYFTERDYKVAIRDYVPLSFMRGSKNARIVVSDGSSRSVFCFVDLANGNILKADGWKAPAKGVRGNIANGAADVTVYGAVYAR